MEHNSPEDICESIKLLVTDDQLRVIPGSVGTVPKIYVTAAGQAVLKTHGIISREIGYFLALPDDTHDFSAHNHEGYHYQVDMDTLIKKVGDTLVREALENVEVVPTLKNFSMKVNCNNSR